ncbi:MAG: winged helix-turn-helix domain-containing protein [Methanothrix sp.]
MENERGEATKKIYERLKIKPAYPKQLSDELGIPYSTVKHNLLKGILKNADIIKQLPDGRYAIASYKPEKETICDAHDLFRKRFLRSPRPEELAYTTQESPENTRLLLYKYVQGYSEPTDKEIEIAATEVWNLIFLGMDYSDLPDNSDMDDEDVLYNNFNYDAFYQFDAPPFSLIERSKSYIRENPEMIPRIISTQIGNKLEIEAVWEEDVLVYIRKFPQYGNHFGPE